MKKGEDSEWDGNKFVGKHLSVVAPISKHETKSRPSVDASTLEGGHPSCLLVVIHLGGSAYPPTRTSTATSPLWHGNSTAAQKTIRYGAVASGDELHSPSGPQTALQQRSRLWECIIPAARSTTNNTPIAYEAARIKAPPPRRGSALTQRQSRPAIQPLHRCFHRGAMTKVDPGPSPASLVRPIPPGKVK